MYISESKILLHDDPQFSFVGEQVGMKSCIWIYTKFEHEGSFQKRLKIRYVIMHAHMSYSILIVRPSLNAMGAIVSTLHLATKFSSNIGTIITVHTD